MEIVVIRESRLSNGELIGAKDCFDQRLPDGKNKLQIEANRNPAPMHVRPPGTEMIRGRTTLGRGRFLDCDLC